MQKINSRNIFSPIFLVLIIVFTILAGSFSIKFWKEWPRIHLSLYEQALEDKSNLRKSPRDERYDNPYKDNTSLYGSFGDTYGSLTSIAACLALIASLSALSIQTFLYWDQKNHQSNIERQNKTFELYDEFNSIDMFQARIKADLFLRTNYDDFYKINDDNISSYIQRSQEPRTPQSDQSIAGGADSIWPIVRFYQKLIKSIDLEKIDEDMLFGLFGEVFIWWYFAYFEDKLVNVTGDIRWDTADDLKKLQQWFDKHQNKNKTLYDCWLSIAKSDQGKIKLRYDAMRNLAGTQPIQTPQDIPITEDNQPEAS